MHLYVVESYDTIKVNFMSLRRRIFITISVLLGLSVIVGMLYILIEVFQDFSQQDDQDAPNSQSHQVVLGSEYYL